MPIAVNPALSCNRKTFFASTLFRSTGGTRQRLSARDMRWCSLLNIPESQCSRLPEHSPWAQQPTTTIGGESRTPLALIGHEGPACCWAVSMEMAYRRCRCSRHWGNRWGQRWLMRKSEDCVCVKERETKWIEGNDATKRWMNKQVGYVWLLANVRESH